MKILAAIVGILFALWYTSFIAKADGIGECMEKARIAVQVARALDQGFSLDAIHFTYPNAKSPQEVAAADGVIAEIKAAVAKHYAALDGKDQRPDRAAQAYLEECAYNYGKLRRTDTASSQSIADEQARIDRCNTLLEDERYIKWLHEHGQSFEAMRMRATRSSEMLGAERFDKVMKLIDAAESSGDVPAWYDGKHVTCMGEGT